MKESEILTSHKICGGSERVAHAYTSLTDTLELRMFQKNRDPGGAVEDQSERGDFHYVIRYDGEEPMTHSSRSQPMALPLLIPGNSNFARVKEIEITSSPCRAFVARLAQHSPSPFLH